MWVRQYPHTDLTLIHTQTTFTFDQLAILEVELSQRHPVQAREVPYERAESKKK